MRLRLKLAGLYPRDLSLRAGAVLSLDSVQMIGGGNIILAIFIRQSENKILILRIIQVRNI